MEAAQLAQKQGVSVAVYDLRYAKPLDEELVAAVGAKFDHIITVEDGSLRGGVGEAVVKMLADKGVCKRVTTLGVGDKFVEQGTVAELYRECGYDAEGILKVILEKK